MQRITALDYARGFTVLCIPMIHTVMVFSDPAVHTTIFGYALTFIAEGPGAQLFMTIMGIAFTFKNKHDTKAIFTRALFMLLAGYALNIFKFIVPEVFFGLPKGVHRDLQLFPGQEIQQLLSTGDILHFAAIALIITHVAYRIKNYWFWSAIIALIIIFIAPILFDCGNNYFIQLFTGQPPRIFFPILPWIVYPLIGLTIGKLLQQYQQQAFRKLLLIGVALICAGTAITINTNQISVHGFYRTYPGETLIHIGIVLMTIVFWNYIARKYAPTPFLQLLHYCSRHITSIYIIQWTLICWLLPFIGYQTLNTLQSIMMSIYITITTAIIQHTYKLFSGNKS